MDDNPIALFFNMVAYGVIAYLFLFGFLVALAFFFPAPPLEVEEIEDDRC
jgi:hypothetical protein